MQKTLASDDYFNMGVKLFQSKKFENALEEFEKCLSISPLHHQAHTYKCHSLEKLGRFSEAILSYSQLLRLFPRSTDSLTCKIKLLERMGELNKAILVNKTLIMINPLEANYYLMLGKLFLKKGLTFDAFENFEIAHEHKEREIHGIRGTIMDPEIDLYLANEYFLRGKFHISLKLFTRVLKSRKDFQNFSDLYPYPKSETDVLFKRGTCYMRIRNFKLSIIDFKKLLDMDVKEQVRLTVQRQLKESIRLEKQKKDFLWDIKKFSESMDNLLDIMMKKIKEKKFDHMYSLLGISKTLKKRLEFFKKARRFQNFERLFKDGYLEMHRDTINELIMKGEYIYDIITNKNEVEYVKKQENIDKLIIQLEIIKIRMKTDFDRDYIRNRDMEILKFADLYSLINENFLELIGDIKTLKGNIEMKGEKVIEKCCSNNNIINGSNLLSTDYIVKETTTKRVKTNIFKAVIKVKRDSLSQILQMVNEKFVEFCNIKIINKIYNKYGKLVYFGEVKNKKNHIRDGFGKSFKYGDVVFIGHFKNNKKEGEGMVINYSHHKNHLQLVSPDLLKGLSSSSINGDQKGFKPLKLVPKWMFTLFNRSSSKTSLNNLSQFISSSSHNVSKFRRDSSYSIFKAMRSPSITSLSLMYSVGDPRNTHDDHFDLNKHITSKNVKKIIKKGIYHKGKLIIKIFDSKDVNVDILNNLIKRNEEDNEEIYRVKVGNGSYFMNRVIFKTKAGFDDFKKQFLNEVKLLKYPFCHQNILNIKGMSIIKPKENSNTNNQYQIGYFSKYFDKSKTLKALLDNEDDALISLELDEILLILLQISEGLRFLHNKGIALKELNLESVFINEFKQPKLYYRMATKVPSKKRKKKKWTRPKLNKQSSFIAPDKVLTKSSDVYSFGRLIIAMLLRNEEGSLKELSEMFKEKSEEEKREEIIHLEDFEDSKKKGKWIVDIARMCLASDVKKRPTFDEIIDTILKNCDLFKKKENVVVNARRKEEEIEVKNRLLFSKIITRVV